MMKNETLIFDCLFLHDTQMTELEREQASLRKIHSRMMAECAPTAGFAGRDASNRQTALPFNFALPFCPIAGSVNLEGKLTIGRAVVRDGWIVRPVSGNDTDAHQAQNDRIVVPGYTQLPAEPCIILGYAGGAAESLLEAARESAGATPTGIVNGFSVSSRYRASLTLEIGFGDGGEFSSVWTVGPARWEKA
jgi:hypothetical protein